MKSCGTSDVVKPEKPDEVAVVDVEVRFDAGGMNYFSGVTMLRGYYLSVTPMVAGPTWTRTLAFSGTQTMLQEAARFHRPTLESVAAKVKEHPKFQPTWDHVMKKGQITV